MSNIFLSHNHEDKPFVRRLADDLIKHGVRIWIDEAEMLVEDSLIQKITEGIRNIDNVGVILSPNSVNSKWVQKEVDLAMNLEIAGKKVTVLPLLYQSCEIPLFLIDKIYASFCEPDGSYESGLQLLLRRLKQSVPSIIIPKKMEEITVEIPGLPKNAKPLVMVKIPAGEFIMGSPEDEEDRWDDEGPMHRVMITNEFYIGKYPITQAQWRMLMGENPSYFKDNPNHPVESVSWNDCHEFLKKINKMGLGEFRLPSEAEWEYACRAGEKTNTRFYWGDDLNYSMINEYAWFYANNGTKEVGLKLPNHWGLYDMSGNVWEWCEDHRHKNYEGAPKDGRAWVINDISSELYRVIRGGSWIYGAGDCRSAARDGYGPTYSLNILGFRVVYFRT